MPLRLVVLCVAGFLLLSMGGAIFAAPATLPLLWFAGRGQAGRITRGFAAALAALTMAEVVWFAVYTAAGEPKPAIWLAPLVAATLTAAAYLWRRH